MTAGAWTEVLTEGTLSRETVPHTHTDSTRFAQVARACGQTQMFLLLKHHTEGDEEWFARAHTGTLVRAPHTRLWSHGREPDAHSSICDVEVNNDQTCRRMFREWRDSLPIMNFSFDAVDAPPAKKKLEESPLSDNWKVRHWFVWTAAKATCDARLQERICFGCGLLQLCFLSAASFALKINVTVFERQWS